MNWIAFFACVRREVLRGRRSLLVLLMTGGVALFLAVFLSGATTVFAVMLATIGSFVALAGPSGDLGADKLAGHLEFDRALPVSGRLVAAGRLIGAAIRLLPIGLCTLALAVAGSREAHARVSWLLLVVAAPIGAYVAAVLLSWTLLALNARWQFRNLWWLPLTIMFGPRFVLSLLPPATVAALEKGLSGFGHQLAGFVLSPWGGFVALGALVVLPVLCFAGATLLFASGLERYRYDANVLGAMMGKAPKRELGAIGRGPVLAVTRLRLRVAAEQQRRQLIFLAALVLVLLVGSGEIRDFARTYVRVLAFMLPCGIGLQLIQSRAQGQLEGLQQLPHRAATVALGHLLAICAMAIPGSAVVLLARAVGGDTPRLLDGLLTWGWFVSGAWVTAVLAVWLKKTYLLVTALLILLLFVAGFVLLGGEGLGNLLTSLLGAFRALKTSGGALVPVAAACLLALIGLPLFARGLSTYQHKPR